MTSAVAPGQPVLPADLLDPVALLEAHDRPPALAGEPREERGGVNGWEHLEIVVAPPTKAETEWQSRVTSFVDASGVPPRFR